MYNRSKNRYSKKNRPVFQPSYAQKLLLLIFSILVFLTLFFAVTAWLTSSKIFSEQSESFMEQSAENAYLSINRILDDAKGISTQVLHNDILQDMMQNDPGSLSHADELNTQMQAYIDKLISTNANSAVQFVNVYMKNGLQSSSEQSLHIPYQSYEDCYAAILEASSVAPEEFVSLCWIDSAIVYPKNIPTRCLIGMRFIYEKVTLEKVGVIVVGIRQSALQSVFKQLPEKAYLVLRDGTVISSSQPSAYGLTLEITEQLDTYQQQKSHLISLPSQQEYFIYRLPEGASYFVVPFTNELQTSTSAFTYFKSILIISLVALMLAFLLSLSLSKQFTRSLVSLKDMVQQVYNGALNTRFHPNTNDEIAYLGLKINDMLDKIETYNQLQAQAAVEKQYMELQLLQSQTNPHLLYNTLNSVICFIRQGDIERSEHLIFSLSEFFRTALSSGVEEIALREELAMIEYYLKLQNLGCGKAYTLHYQIPDALMDYKLLRMLLQPLVENAVIHGFENYRDDGDIFIYAKEDQTETGESVLHIYLEDNGMGILAEEIPSLTAYIHGNTSRIEYRHYGLYSVGQRIKNKYGTPYGLAIESIFGEFTRVTLTLPSTSKEL